MTLSVEKICSLPDLLGLEADWRRLYESSSNLGPYSNWDWAISWWQTFASAKFSPRVLVFRLGLSVVGIAPFYSEALKIPLGLKFRRWGVLGDRNVGSTYLDILADDLNVDSVVSSLSLYLSKESEFEYIEFRGIREGSLIDRVSRSSFLNAKSIRNVDVICSVVSLGESWGCFLSSLSKNKRKEFRRKDRRMFQELEADFQDFHEINESEGVVESPYKDLKELNRQRGREMGISGGYLDPKFAAFQDQVVPKMISSGSMRLLILKVRQKSIAALQIICHRGTWYAYQGGFDSSYTSDGPGTLLDFLSMTLALDQSGITNYDFGPGEYSYKEHYHPIQSKTLAVTIFSNTYRAKLIRLALNARSRFRRLVGEALVKFRKNNAVIPTSTSITKL